MDSLKSFPPLWWPKSAKCGKKFLLMPAHIDPESMVSWGDLDPPEKLKFSQNANIILTNEISTYLLQECYSTFLVWRFEI